MNKLLTAIIVLFFIPAVAISQEIVLVMRNGNFMPYQHFPDNQEPKGLYIDIVREAGKRLNLKINIKKYPWKRCQKYAVYGDVDGIIGLFREQEFLNDLHFVQEPLAFEELAFFTLNTEQIQYNGNIETLYPFTIGIIYGNSFGHVWEQHSKNFSKLDYSPNLDFMVKKLLGRRIPLMVCDKMIFEYFSMINKGTIIMPGAQKKQLDQIIALHPSIGLNAGYIAFTKAENSDRNKKIADNLSKTIKGIKKSELFLKMLNKYADF